MHDIIMLNQYQGESVYSTRISTRLIIDIATIATSALIPKYDRQERRNDTAANCHRQTLY